MTSFFGELKRRNVVKVAVAYAIVGWVLIEVSSTVLPLFEAPDWIAQVFAFFVILGFPLALILSWAYEITPEGIKLERDVAAGESITHVTGRKVDFAVIGALVLALGFVGYNYLLDDGEVAAGVLPKSVAVLPFDNMSANPEHAYFAPGLHDEIINQLANLKNLNVIARTSVMQYAGAARPITEIASELNVGTIMEGSVSYADGRVAIRVQLIDAETGVHLWSDSYNRDFSDVFGIYADIAMNVANALEAEFSLAEQESIERVPTRSPQAYELYLKALAMVPNIAPISPAEYFVALNQAIVLDPDFAPAHATLAFAYGRAFTIFDSEELAGSMEAHEALTRDHAQAALRVDPNQGLAHAALAMIESAHHRLGDAEAHWARAINASPNDVEVLDDAAIFYAYTDELDEANRLLARIRQLDPAVEGGAAYYIRMINGDFRNAAAQFRALMLLVPDDWPMHKYVYTEIGLNEALAGDEERAVETLRLAEQYEPRMSPFALSRIAYAYSRAGRREEAERVFQDLMEVGTDRPDSVLSAFWVFAYLAVGDEERALEWLSAVAEDPGAQAGGMELIMDLAKNVVIDPVLEQSEFMEVRSRLLSDR